MIDWNEEASRDGEKRYTPECDGDGESKSKSE
jgi:hypothetical protein